MTQNTPLTQSPLLRLLEIMALLRSPVGGCPRDLVQSFETIAPYTLEEAHEVVDAIARGDMDALREELGDLLLQVVFHAQMASEQQLFDFDDVATGICDKLTRRHPHVFGDEVATTPEDADRIWAREKAKEAGRDCSDTRDVRFFERTYSHLSAMAQAVQLQGRVAQVGFDWPTGSAVLEKADEELAELQDADRSGDLRHIDEEMGDLLFVLMNYCRKRGIDAAQSLTRANHKFMRRFEGVAAEMRHHHQTGDWALEDMEAAWQRVKAREQRVDERSS